MTESRLESGWVEPSLREEFPGLGLRWTAVEARPTRSPRELRQRLRHLSDRVHGERVLNLRREPIASSYRVFFRQIGIDPEEFRPPAEAAMLERLRAGRFASRNLLDDAIVVSLVETGVSVRAFDADKVTGSLGLRIASRRSAWAATASSSRRVRSWSRTSSVRSASSSATALPAAASSHPRSGSRCAW